MQLWKIAMMVNEVLVAADAPTTQNITIEDVYLHFKREDIFIWLAQDVEPKVDFAWVNLSDQDKAEIFDWLDSMYNAYGGDHRRKWGLENRGLLLLAAWLNEAVIQNSRKDRKEYALRSRE